MYYNSIFQQPFNFIPRYRFEKSVKNLSGDHYCKTFSAWQQFLTCLYPQITGKDSLREIERGLVANHYRLYHLGMTAVAKSTLADAMNRRNPEMFTSDTRRSCIGCTAPDNFPAESCKDSSCDRSICDCRNFSCASDPPHSPFDVF